MAETETSPNAPAPMTLPPLGLLQSTLRKTTEALAHELGSPGAAAPHWSESEWRIARAVAALHGVSSVLATRLRWSGPAGWRSFLLEQRTHTVGRALRLQQFLSSLEARALEQQLSFVALKGAALYALGIYQTGERPMADLDLLVGGADVSVMSQVLATLGLRPTQVSWKEQVFELTQAPAAGRFGEHSGNSVKVDLHSSIAERLPRRLVDISALIAPAAPVPGLNPYPSPAALMTHLLLHAAGEMVFRSLRLIQVHDIALLAARLSAADWDEVLRQHAAPSGLWWAWPPLALVARYYDSVPAAALTALRDCCPEPLRSAARVRVLTEVSYSNMHRSVWPGIDWTQTSRERLAYAAERSLLSVRALLHARTAHTAAPLSTGPADVAPPGQPTRWHRWRPVRPATLNAVRAALSQPL